MKHVGVLEAKTQLSKLLDEIERTGEPVVITRHGKVVATLSQGAPGAAPPRKASAAELVERFRRLREAQPSDPELSGKDWSEVKELGRS